MATINFLVKGSDNPATIYLRFRHGRGHDYTKGTGYLINPRDWNAQKKQPYQRDTHLKNLTTNLVNLSNELIKLFNNTPKDEITGDWIESQISIIKGDIKPEQKRSDILTDCIQYLIDTANIREGNQKNLGLSKSRINSYSNLLKIIKTYQGIKKPYRIKDIDISFGKEFLNWMINDKAYSDGYSRKKLDDLKTVCRDAETDGIDTNPQFGKIKGGKPVNDQILYLSLDELEKIENANIIGDALQNARKWLLFGCGIGQRGGDLLNITDNNFITRDGLEVIELKQQKTGKQVTIPILEETRKILKDGLPRPMAIQNFNTYIKEVCRIAEIDDLIEGAKITMLDKEGKEIPKDENGRYLEKGVKRKIKGRFPKYDLMSSHICRRSFASNLYGILPTPLIMQITAHSSERLLLQYIGKNSLDYARQIRDFYELQKLRNEKETKLKVVKNEKNVSNN
ncbi:site-specific integrase [Arenibacter sp. F26102]|uniref:tyrosine-type recombinase/integrase n=1 Tax=Arenibacter sp. F26102 TaxID=2926416 RepID=UPI001FF307D2|nr:site-specific integrase [Arenibacter sp. F26102]MCK0148211.1 site-specific integrase [Arenibacter sp. F26102]